MAARLIAWALVAGLPVLAGTGRAAVLDVHPDEVEVLANGRCSLIEAVENALADARIHQDCRPGSGADTVRLAVGGNYVFRAPATAGSATALPLITSELTIDGRGSTIRRSDHGSTPPFRFLASLDTQLTLTDLDFVGGRLLTQAFYEGGGVLWQRGGELILRRVRLLDNGVGDNGRGGAILITTAGNGRSAQARLEDCLFQDNFVSSVPGQHSTGGGALFIESGELEIERCAFIGNRTQPVALPQGGGGGALAITDHAADGSHIVDGLATRVWVRDSTFSGNRAVDAGAIRVHAVQGFHLALELLHVTLVDNLAVSPSNGIGAHAGAVAPLGQVFISYATSILHGNGTGASDRDCLATGGIQRVYWQSLGGNLLHPDRGCTADPFGDDFLDTQLWNHIEPVLADHGHDLKADSPLVDAVTWAACQPGHSLDQRGRTRAGGPGAGGAHCDVGAVERHDSGDDRIFAHGFQ